MTDTTGERKVFRKLMVVLVCVVAFAAVTLVTIDTIGLSTDRCADDGIYWILISPLCLGESNPHEPSLAYVAALGLVLVVWMVKKMRSWISQRKTVSGE